MTKQRLRSFLYPVFVKDMINLLFVMKSCAQIRNYLALIKIQQAGADS